MALTSDSIPVLVGQAILENLRENLVYSQLANEDYMGDVAPGNTVKIPAIGSVTVGDYTEYTDMSDEAVTDSSQSLSIDQQKYFSIVIDDVDAAMTKPEIMAAYAREASHQMQATVDSFLATTLAAGGTITAGLGTNTTPIEVNSANIGTQLRLIARKLDDANVPRQGRYVVLPPWAVQKLVTANITDSTSNVQELSSAMVANYAGFSVLMSQAVPNTTSAKYKIVAGTNQATTMAMAINNTEMIRHPTQFADKMRGLAVYGAKVTRGGALAVAHWNEAAET